MIERDECHWGICDSCRKEGPFAFCVAPRPVHLHACKREGCLEKVRDIAQKEATSATP